MLGPGWWEWPSPGSTDLWPHPLPCLTHHSFSVSILSCFQALSSSLWSWVPPGSSPGQSLLHLQAHSRMILCTVIIPTLEMNVKSTSPTPRHVFPCSWVMWRHVWRMVISLFINSQTQFQDIRRPSNLTSERKIFKESSLSRKVFLQTRECFKLSFCYLWPKSQANIILQTSR